MPPVGFEPTTPFSYITSIKYSLVACSSPRPPTWHICFQFSLYIQIFFVTLHHKGNRWVQDGGTDSWTHFLLHKQELVTASRPVCLIYPVEKCRPTSGNALISVHSVFNYDIFSFSHVFSDYLFFRIYRKITWNSAQDSPRWHYGPGTEISSLSKAVRVCFSFRIAAEVRCTFCLRGDVALPPKTMARVQNFIHDVEKCELGH